MGEGDDDDDDDGGGANRCKIGRKDQAFQISNSQKTASTLIRWCRAGAG
jgi:hypothetical protein